MQFNEKLKKLRREKGVSQDELAKNIYVSRSAVAKWESGLGLPSDESLTMLAQYFNVNETELLTDSATENTAPADKHSKSKRNTAIIALSILLAVCLAAAAVVAVIELTKKPNAAPVPPTIAKELIFDTEKDGKTPANNYSDDEISVDKPFTDSRIFDLEENDILRIPQLLVKTTVNDAVSYENADLSKVTFFAEKQLDAYVNHNNTAIFVQLIDAAPQYEGFVNFKYGSLLLSVKIVKTPIPIQSIEVKLEDDSNELGLTESKPLNVSISPYNATYRDYTLSIEKIEKPDGEPYSDNIDEYAVIENKFLKTTDKIAVGSVIYITAATTKNDVKSPVLTVEVTRIAVQSISSNLHYIDSGASEQLQIKLYPANATANVLHEPASITLLTDDIATLTQNDGEGIWTVTASGKYSAARQNIKIKITLDEGFEEIIEIYIYPIQPRDIILINADTGEELAETTYVTPNSTLTVKAIVAPANATYEKITYGLIMHINNFSRYASISQDGVVSVTKLAQSGMEIFVSARATSIDVSKAYRLVVL